MISLPANIESFRQFLSVQEIAEAAGVSRRTVYNVFLRESNHQGVISIILQKVEEMKQAVAQISN